MSGPLRRAAPVLLLAVVALLASCGGGGGEGGSLPQGHPERCRGLVDASTQDCYVRELRDDGRGADDPGPAVAKIAELARKDGGFLLTSCHGIMHTVGRTYAREHGVTLGNLMDFLPRINDPGC